MRERSPRRQIKALLPKPPPGVTVQKGNDGSLRFVYDPSDSAQSAWMFQAETLCDERGWDYWVTSA